MLGRFISMRRLISARSLMPLGTRSSRDTPAALASSEGAIHRIDVGEIVGRGDRAAGEALPHQEWQHGLHVVVEAMRGVAGDGFVVVASVVMAAEPAPLLCHELRYRLTALPMQDIW